MFYADLSRRRVRRGTTVQPARPVNSGRSPMLEKVDRFNEALSSWMQSISLAAVVFMVILTCIDVVGAKLFRLPVPGSLDMIMLAQLIAITFAAAMTLIRDRHVSVEFIVVLLLLSFSCEVIHTKTTGPFVDF